MERTSNRYQFGHFCLDAKECVLLRDGRLVPLPAKVLNTLLVLVRNQGHLLEKDFLMNEVWPDEVVEEGNLAQHIFMLRKSLGDVTDSPKYIETVPRRGYRFIARVRAFRDEPSDSFDNLSQHWAIKTDPRGLLTDLQSIAVLPFKTLSAGGRDEYLGLGIADAVITKLSNVKLVNVRPTSAVRNFNREDPVSAGDQLRVTTVLEGTIQESSDYIRVTVQLVSVRDGGTLWADKFDEKFTSIFAIEDSISEQVAKALALKLTAEEQAQLAKRYTENTQAYRAYLRGRYFFEKRTPAAMTKAIEYFELAIKLDPQYALAYAGLADGYSTLGGYDFLPPRDSIPKAIEASQKALSIEPKLAEAHAALGRARMFDWDWSAAEKEFKLAIDLNPSYATARHWYAVYLRHLRRFDESLRESKKAEELEPISAGRKSTMGATLYCARRYDQAIEQLWQALELDPDNTVAHYYLGRTLVQMGMWDEAITQYQKALSLFGKSIEVLAHLGHIYAISGKKGTARKILAELEELSKRDYVPHAYKAVIYIGLNEKDQAFECLERASQEQDQNLDALGVDPLFDSLREDPRYTLLLQRIGLVPHLLKSESELNEEGRAIPTVSKFERQDRGKAIDSLAVLVFANSSSDPDMEYLSDGITESLINSLSHLPQLKVMALSSVSHYKGVGLHPQEIGRTLGVRGVMMGRIQQIGERLVISAELVDVEDGSRIWGDHYHLESWDIFSLQEELAHEITEKLRPRLSAEQRDRLKRPTENVPAYEFYLRGRHSWSKRTNESLEKGVEYFRQAIAEDPNYSLAHVGIADCLVLLGLFGAERPILLMPQAKAAALKAVQLDETLGEAYASLAQIKLYFDWDWAGAAADFHEAVRLNPTYPTARQWHGEYLVAMEQLDEGLAELKRARALEPFSLIVNTNLGLNYYLARQYDLAIEQLQRTIELEPNFFRAHLHLGMVHVRKRMYREGIAALERARSIRENSWTLAGLGHAYAAAGEKARAEVLLKQLSQVSETRYVSAFMVAVIYAGFDDQVDQTFAWLERAYEERVGLLVWLKVWPVFDKIRSDVRFVNLLGRIGFPGHGISSQA
jgi:TolB-like protein/Flp pilus assembly protein TadD